MAGRPPSEKTGPFPNRVRELRLAAGITQRELADRIGLSPGQVGKIERGENKLHSVHVERLSQALRCQRWELFSDAASATQTALLALLDQLSPEDQDRLLNFGRALAQSAAPSATDADSARRKAG